MTKGSIEKLVHIARSNGASREQTVKAVRTIFPLARTNLNCVRWYDWKRTQQQS